MEEAASGKARVFFYDSCSDQQMQVVGSRDLRAKEDEEDGYSQDEEGSDSSGDEVRKFWEA
jgi:hypothetical protein